MFYTDHFTKRCDGVAYKPEVFSEEVVRRGLGFSFAKLNYIINSDPNSSRSQHEVTTKTATQLENIPSLFAEYSVSYRMA